MKIDRLESFVENNRHEFDNLEPSDELWNAISQRLDEKDKTRQNRFVWMKVAAAVAVILMIPGMLYFLGNEDRNQSANSEQVNPEVEELIEAEAYYAQQVSGKLAEIQKCYKVYPELKVEVEDDLTELETMYQSLKNDLQDNVSNKEVIEAMIENNRNRMKLVEDILEQINC